MSIEFPFMALAAWFTRDAGESAGDGSREETAPAAQGPPVQGADPPGRPPARAGETFIGPGVRLAGSLHCTGDVAVQGRLEGPLATKGRVVVERGGLTEGDITAAVIRIRGRTRGRLVASTEIVLEQGCEHRGSIAGPELVVESGALMEGEVRVGPRCSAGPVGAPQGEPSS